MTRIISCASLAACLAAALFAAGCGTTSSEPEPLPPLQALSSDPVELVDCFGVRVGEEMLKAFAENDYEGFVEFFRDDLRKRVERSDFQQLRTIGRLVGQEYVTVIRKPHTASYVWRVRFEAPSQNGPVVFDSLFMYMLGKQGDDYQIIACRFE